MHFLSPSFPNKNGTPAARSHRSQEGDPRFSLLASFALVTSSTAPVFRQLGVGSRTLLKTNLKTDLQPELKQPGCYPLFFNNPYMTNKRLFVLGNQHLFNWLFRVGLKKKSDWTWHAGWWFEPL